MVEEAEYAFDQGLLFDSYNLTLEAARLYTEASQVVSTDYVSALVREACTGAKSTAETRILQTLEQLYLLSTGLLRKALALGNLIESNQANEEGRLEESQDVEAMERTAGQFDRLMELFPSAHSAHSAGTHGSMGTFNPLESAIIAQSFVQLQANVNGSLEFRTSNSPRWDSSLLCACMYV